MAELRRLQAALAYEFRDVDILRQALTHRSSGRANNERMEFLGDAILGFEIAENLFRMHLTATEGQLSRSRSQLVKRETLAEVARQLNLGDYLILGSGELRSGGQNRDSILSDTVEAIIAAVYMDSGMDESRALVRRILAKRIAASAPEQLLKDAKTRLQEFLQARGSELPIYEVISVNGNPHQQLFKVKCALENLGVSATAAASSRRKAEQEAATLVLSQMDKR